MNTTQLVECEPCRGSGFVEAPILLDTPRNVYAELLATKATTIEEAARQVPGSEEAVKRIRKCDATPGFSHTSRWRVCAHEQAQLSRVPIVSASDPLHGVLYG